MKKNHKYNKLRIQKRKNNRKFFIIKMKIIER